LLLQSTVDKDRLIGSLEARTRTVLGAREFTLYSPVSARG